MAKSAFIISFFGLLIVPLSAYYLLKGTMLDITELHNNPWPLLWYYSLIITLVPLVIISALKIENVPVLYKAMPGTEGIIAILVIFVLILYIMSLAFFLRVFKLYNKKIMANLPISKISEILNALTSLGVIIFIIFYFLGYKHAYITAFLERKNLLEIRLSNQYKSYVPSQIASILPLIGYFQSALAGYLGRSNRLKSFLYLVLALFFLSTSGDKGPPIWGVIIWILARSLLIPKRLFSLKFVIKILRILAVLLILVYFVVSMQIPNINIDQFAEYLLMRLGIEQMAGVYETFALIQTNSLPEGNFYFHIIPGARFFVDYIDYHKALMMVTEGYGYSEMGVKNTLFIAEAWAIGGMSLMIFSPIIVGFSTVLGLFILIKFIRRFICKELDYHIALILYLKTHNITGGFADFPMLKGLILILGQIAIIYVWSLIFINFKRKLK